MMEICCAQLYKSVDLDHLLSLILLYNEITTPSRTPIRIPTKVKSVMRVGQIGGTQCIGLELLG